MKTIIYFFIGCLLSDNLYSSQKGFGQRIKRLGILSLIFVLMPAITSARMSLEEKLNSGYVIKDITIPQGQDMADVLVDTIIRSNPQAVWEVLTNINSWPKWLPMASKANFLSDEASALVTPEIAKDQSKVIEIDKRYPPGKDEVHEQGHFVRVAYEEYNLPWPLKNEWVVRRYIYDEGPDLLRASWKRIDSKRSDDDGFWEVRPWKDGTTHLTYFYRVKPKEHVPEVVFKTAVSFTVNSMIKALRHEAAHVNKTTGG